MVKAALTGVLGSGKTTALGFFKKLGAAVGSADAWVHDELRTNKALRDEIVRVFGSGVVMKGRLDRRVLAEIVFKEESRVSRLNSLVHPWVERRLLDFFKKNSRRKLVMVEVPLLFEAGFEKFFDVTIGIATDPRRQRSRSKTRGRKIASDSRRRMRWQLTAEAKISRCDFVIDNSGSKKATFEQINFLYQKLMEENKWKS